MKNYIGLFFLHFLSVPPTTTITTTKSVKVKRCETMHKCVLDMLVRERLRDIKLFKKSWNIITQ